MARSGFILALGTVAALLASVARAADRLAVIGQQLFIDECAVSHGIDATGSWPLAPVLSVSVPDLTTLKARNDGTFPMSRLHALTDGRRPVPGHGTSGMPIWGALFRTEVEETGARGGYRELDAQLLVAGRITATLRFLESMQTP